MAILPGLLPAEVAYAAPHVKLMSRYLPPVADYDLVNVEHEWLAPIIGVASSDRGRTRWAITLHNLLSTRLRQTASQRSKRRVRWLFERDAGHADRLEASVVRRYDRTIVVSQPDADRLGTRVDVVPNGVDLERFNMSPLPPQPRLLFSGSWNWTPNADAAIWACTELLPRLTARLPDISLSLVGRDPPASVRDLGRLPGVETHFDVPSVFPYLQNARVAIVPLSVGSGTRLKALEAMAAGRPLVGTSIGLEGLDLVDGDTAFFADSVEAMSDRIVELCLDDGRAATMAAAARQLVESHFGWESIVQRYWTVVQDVVTAGRV